MVQNCPNLFSEATRNPLGKVVTSVTLSSSLVVAYLALFRPGRGVDKEGCSNEFFRGSEDFEDSCLTSNSGHLFNNETTYNIFHRWYHGIIMM